MIGVFDSGLGGLTILKEIKKQLPEYDYMYFGDTLHVPYGNRSDKAIYNLTKNACDFLFKQGCKLIIVACNTATSKALRRLQQEYLRDRARSGENILGVIRPIVEVVATKSKGKVGVIGTRGTVNSNAYMVELKQQKGKVPNFKTYQVACPLLVPLIEEDWLNKKETKSILRYYLRGLKEKHVDTLILGCTHYPLLIDKIRQIMGNSCDVPNPGEIVATALKDYLQRHPEIDKGITQKGKSQYFVTDWNSNFSEIAQRFLNEKIKIKEITL